jgi:DNA polymerase-1
VDFFQNRLGQQFTVFTASGAPSASKDQLQKFIDNGYSAQDPDGIASQAASFIISTKQAQKKADSYFKNFLEFQHDGKLHTSFQTLRAKTGRMSSTRPALQTVSKQDAVLRDAFIPPQGYKLLSCDYSQMELRMLGHFSGDKNLQDAFRKADTEGEDFFVLLGKNIFKDPNFVKKDPRRNIVKTTLYATIYGATPEKIAKTAGVPVDEIHDFLRELDSTYPGISEFQRQIIALGDQREREEGQGYVNTPNGRRIPCARGDSRVLVNYIIQGSSADIMKDALIRLDAAGYTDYLNLVIHDEVIACLPEDEFEVMSKDIEEIMSVIGKFSVDIPAERSDPYDRWGDKVRANG